MFFKTLLLSCSLFVYPNFERQVHPFFLSVTEIQFNEHTGHLELSIKLFIDDFEKTLQKLHGQRINLLHPQDTLRRDQYIDEYIQSNLKISVNGDPQNIQMLGFEKEGEAMWCYFESDLCASPKSIEIYNTLLYQAIDSQVNIMHVSIGKNRKSQKLDQPESKAVFNF